MNMYIIPPNASCILIRSYGCCYEYFNVFWRRSNDWDMEYRNRDGIDICSRYNMILSCAKCEHWDKEKGICPVPLRIIPDDVLEMAILFAQTEDEYDVWYHTGDPADHRCELALKLNAEYAVRHQICRYEPKKQGGEGL